MAKKGLDVAVEVELGNAPPLKFVLQNAEQPAGGTAAEEHLRGASAAPFSTTQAGPLSAGQPTAADRCGAAGQPSANRVAA